MLQVSKQISKYSTQEIRRDFIEKYQHFATTSKSILQSILHDLTGDSSSTPTPAQKAVDERVAKEVLSVGDPDVFIDLRKLNGNPSSTHFDDFWAKLSLFLEEVTPAGDDRKTR